MIKLLNEQIIDRWSILIEGAENNGQEVFENTLKNLDKIEPPNIDVSKKDIAPSFIKGLLGNKKPFLIVKNNYLENYSIYIGARNYGKQLSVSWYLIVRPVGALQWIGQKIPDIPIIQTIVVFFLLPFIFLAGILRLTKIGKSVSAGSLDVFDLEELNAYTSTCHHAVLEAVADLMREAGQNPSTIDRKSKGFLSIS